MTKEKKGKKSKKKLDESEFITYGKDKLLRDDAEEIYKNYKAGDFDLSKKARKIEVDYTHEDTEAVTGKTLRELKVKGTLAENFSTAISRYQISRGSTSWNEVAHDLVLTYNDLRTHGCIVPGKGMYGKLNELEKENTGLKGEIVELQKENDELFSTCPQCGYSKAVGGPDFTTSVQEEEK